MASGERARILEFIIYLSNCTTTTAVYLVGTQGSDIQLGGAYAAGHHAHFKRHERSTQRVPSTLRVLEDSGQRQVRLPSIPIYLIPTCMHVFQSSDHPLS